MIIIKTRKVIGKVTKTEAYCIMGIKMLGPKNLPKEYFKDFPYCLFDGNTIKIADNINSYTLIRNGEILSRKTFYRYLKLIKQCGNRLQKINQKLKWSGEETFKI